MNCVPLIAPTAQVIAKRAINRQTLRMESLVRHLNAKHNLDAAQIAALNTTQVKGLLPTQIGAFSSAQLNAFELAPKAGAEVLPL